MNVSFDFDGTLHRDGHPLWLALQLLRWHHQSGDRVLIVTTRTRSHEDPTWWCIHEPCRVLVAQFVPQYSLPVQRVVFTSHELKAASLVRHGIGLHYDNDPSEIASAANAGVQAVLLNGDSLYA